MAPTPSKRSFVHPAVALHHMQLSPKSGEHLWQCKQVVIVQSIHDTTNLDVTTMQHVGSLVA
jgi:hypothetical protein